MSFMTKEEFDLAWDNIKDKSILPLAKCAPDLRGLYEDWATNNNLSFITQSAKTPTGRLTNLGEIFLYGKVLETSVVYIYNSKYDVYIGSASNNKFSNPFEVPPDADYSEKRNALVSFIRHLMRYEPNVLDNIEELRGMVLGCHCKSMTCHGYVYKALASKDRSEYKSVLESMLLTISRD